MLFLILFLFIPVIFLLFRLKDYLKKYEDIEKLPGPTTWDLLSFYMQRSSEGMLTYFRSLNEKYGPTVKIWIKPFKPAILTTDIEFVEKIYKSNDHFYTPSFGELESLLRNSFATTRSREIWKTDKQVVNKALTNAYISSRMVKYNKRFDQFIDMINKNLGEPIDVESVLYTIFAEIIIEIINDPQLKAKNEEIQDYYESRRKYMNLLLEKMNSPNPFYKFTKNYRAFTKFGLRIIRIGEQFLERHKNVPIHQREKNNLIYAMLDSGMPHDRIVDNMNNVIGGGYDTSVLPLSLTLYELGKRPDIQQKILEEVISLVGRHSSKEITLNDLNNMTYLNCVVREGTRLFFPSPFIDRLLTEDVKIRDLTIPKGTQVIFHMPEILKSEENFANAKLFCPERFMPENFDETTRKAYISFGYGLKTCPGKNLAYAVMKLFIAKILREFEICTVDNDREIKLKSDIIFRSVDGIHLVLQKRHVHLNE